MERINFGRRLLSFENGQAILTSTSITERSFDGEDEESFTRRLLGKYGANHGTIEIVFKGGRPDYAVITIT
jgi:hypothetical protein